MLKALIAHNHYGERARGGEAVVVENETALLRENGISVKVCEVSNSEILKLSFYKKIRLGVRARNDEVYKLLSPIVREFQPDLVHIHNYKYYFSASIFEFFNELNIPIILSVHNYRLLCPGGQFRRGDFPCEECLENNPFRSLWRPGCASKISTAWLQYMFYLGTEEIIKQTVSAFVLPSEFMKERFVKGGFSPSKLFVKPYFLFDPLKEQGAAFSKPFSSYAIYIGRLSSEKGVSFLVDAWREIDLPLVIVGDGPEYNRLKENAPCNVVFLGERSRAETFQYLQAAEFLVFPSVCYEGLGMTLLEALAFGIPIVASDLGARREVVEHEQNGLLFTANDKTSFISAIRRVLDNPSELLRWKREARRRYELFYTPEANFRELQKIYQVALDRKCLEL